MAAKIQLASGDITTVKNSRPEDGYNLIPAELFWQAKTDDSSTVATISDSQAFPRYDEGTLYIGRPSLSNSTAGLAEAPIPIAGARAYKAFVFKGYLSDGSITGTNIFSGVTSILDSLFQYARIGDFYIWKTDAGSAEDTNSDDDIHPFFQDGFRNTDALLITDNGGESNINTTTGCIIDQTKIKYVLLKYSSSSSRNISFTKDDTLDGKLWDQFNVNTVQNAILEEQSEKLEWAGVISSQATIPAEPIIGGFYLIDSDDIEFNFKKNEDATLTKIVNSAISEDKYFKADKGDFVFWHQEFEVNSVTLKATIDTDKGYWVRISSGYTNADEIDYYDADRQNERDTFISGLYNTFSDDHKVNFLNASDTVHKALDFLMSNKAELDEQGKIPLSQLHDTVLGALQFKGKWQPLKTGTYKIGTSDQITNDENSVDIYEKDGKYYVCNTNILNSIPGYGSYSDGDGIETSTNVGEDVTKPSAGDYYVVDFSNCTFTGDLKDSFVNLQWTDATYTTTSSSEAGAQSNETDFELNKSDWIVYCNSDAQDTSNTNGAVTVGDGYWTIIDNSDRLSALQYIIDTSSPNGFRDISLEENIQLTLVGTPILKATNKIGLVNSGNNTVTITGHSLIDQLENEDSITYYYPRYNNTTGTIENSYTEDNGDKTTVHSRETDNKTIIHANLNVGETNEHRDEMVYGNIYIKPHVLATEGNAEKSILSFDVTDDSDNSTTHTVNLFAQNGLTSGTNHTYYGISEKTSTVSEVNIALPEQTSTIIGKLTGVSLKSTRLTKSTVDGYIESTSVEEHINTTEETHNDHDDLNNYVEFHSQISTPIGNTYEMWFGLHNNVDYDGENTPELLKGSYTEDDFTDSGDLKVSSVKARFTSNALQTTDTIHVSLPCSSGTLLTQENLAKILNNSDDQYYYSMFGKVINVDNVKQFNSLQRAPMIMVQDLMRYRLLKSHNSTVSGSSDSILIANYITDEKSSLSVQPTYGSLTDDSGNAKIDTKNDTTNIESNVLVGVFDKNTGEISEKRSMLATGYIGVSSEKGTGIIAAQRTHFSDAPQYYSPYDGTANTVVDVVVDMPNESGPLLSGNSLITGGIWLPNVDYTINTSADSDSEEDSVSYIVIINSGSSVEIGDSLQLSANVTTNGSATDSVTWTTSDSSIAAVDQNGKVTGYKVGEATITATSVFDTTKSATVTITVYEADESETTTDDSNSDSSTTE